MKFPVIAIVLFIMTLNLSIGASIKKESGLTIKVIVREVDKKVDILVAGQLFTSYSWPDDIMKPVLYPVLTSEGTEITRGYPVKPRPGERIDHPHHVGIWFNYGDVNGYDFWNNSTAIASDKMGGYGTIKHIKINQIKEGTGEAFLPFWICG